MAVEIEIKIDPTGAVGAAKQVGDALGKTEDAGKKAGDAIDASLMKSISRGEQAKDAIEQLRKELAIIDAGGTSGNRANALERELDMYTKIKGPVVEYTASLRALDSLMEQQKITTSEYADQVTRLNRTFQSARPGDTAGAAQRPTASQDNVNPQAMLSQIAAATAASVAIVKLGDDYVEVSNRVQRFATELHSADSIVRDQLALAGQLHAGLGETSQLYERLRASTTDVNMTYQQSIDLTKTLGEASVLSGHSVGDASMLITKLSYAMESGTLTGREMKSMMREFPAVGDLWEASLGKTRGELVSMANHGTLSIKQLMDALVDGGKTIDEQFSKRTVTAAEEFQHFKDEVVVGFGKIVQESGALKVVGEGFHSMVASITPVTSALDEVIGRLNKIASYAPGSGGGGSGLSLGSAISFAASHGPMWGINKAMEGPDDTGGRTASQVFGFDQGGLTNKQIAEQIEKIEQMRKGVEDLGDQWVTTGGHIANEFGVHIERVRDTWGTTSDALVERFGSALGAFTALADHSVDDWKNGADQIVLHFEGIFDAMIGHSRAALADISHDFVGQIVDINVLIGTAIRLVGADDPWSGHKFKKPPHQSSEEDHLLNSMEKWRKDFDAVIDLYEKGKIAANQYRTEMEKLAATRPPDLGGGGFAGTHDISGGRIQFNLPGMTKPPKADDLDVSAAKMWDAIGTSAKASAVDIDMGNKSIQQADALMKSIATPAEKYKLELDNIVKLTGPFGLGTEDAARAVQDLKDRYSVGLTPLQEWNKEIKTATDLYNVGAIGIDQYKHKLEELSANFDTSAAQGWTNAQKTITDNVKNMSASVSGVLENAWSGVNDNLAKQIATGKADWSSFIDQMKVDAVKLGLQGIEKSLLGSIAGASSAGTVTGESAVGIMLKGAPGIGAAIGAAANAAMKVGSSVSGGGSGSLLGSIFGSGSSAGSSVGAGASDASAAASAGDAASSVADGASMFMARGGSAPPVHVVIANDMRSATLAMLQSPEGRDAVLVHINNNPTAVRQAARRR